METRNLGRKLGRWVHRFSPSRDDPSPATTLLAQSVNACSGKPASAASRIQPDSPNASPTVTASTLAPPPNVHELPASSTGHVCRQQAITVTIDAALPDEESSAGAPRTTASCIPRSSKTPWDKAIEKLNQDARNGFDFEDLRRLSTITEVLEVAKARQTEYEEKSWTYRRRNGEVVVMRDVADRILTNLNKFVPIGNAVFQQGPQSISIAWTAFRFLLQIPTIDMETTGFLLSELEYLSRIMDRCATYETLHTNSKLESAQTLIGTLPDLYAAILMFLWRSKRYFARRTQMRYVMEAVNPYITEFSPMIEKVNKLEQDVENAARAASDEFQINALMNVENITSFQTKALEKFEKIASDEKRFEILRWLSEVTYKRHHSLFSQIRQANTGSWLLRKKDFINWKNSPSSSILWLHGIAGAGKTILASLIIDEFERTKSLDNAFAFFYCKHGEQDRQDAESILNTIVQQLCMTGPENSLPKSVVEFYEKRKKEALNSGRPNLDESIELMSKLIGDFQQTVVVIDALDECDKDSRKKLLRALDNILKSSKSHSTGIVKLFVTSRDSDDIVLKLQNGPNVYIQASDNSNDIKAFAVAEIEKCIADQELLRGSVDPGLKQYIIERLTEQANGMFLWVALQIKSICEENTEGEIKAALCRLPEGLEATYSAIWRRIQGQSKGNRRLAARTLKWIMCTTSPLKPHQIIAAISIEPMQWTENKDHNGLTAMALLQICHNLVVLDEEFGVLRTAHFSVNEFLQKQFKLSEAHTEVAEVCLTILCELRIYSDDESGSHPLRDYAIDNWAEHVRSSGDGSGTLMELQKKFLNPSPTFYAWLRLAEDREHSLRSPIEATAQVTPLWIACWFQLWDIAKYLLSDDVDCNICNIKRDTPLHFAARYGNDEVVRLLLEKDDVDLNRKSIHGETPLSAAAWNGHEDVVQLLLDKEGVDLNSTDDEEDTPLSVAAWNGHDGVVKLLLTKEGVNLNFKDWLWGRTPLSIAAWLGRAAVVKLLLMKPGVDLNSEDYYGETALSLARRRGHTEVVDLIETHCRQLSCTQNRESSPDHSGRRGCE